MANVDCDGCLYAGIRPRTTVWYLERISIIEEIFNIVITNDELVPESFGTKAVLPNLDPRTTKASPVSGNSAAGGG